MINAHICLDLQLVLLPTCCINSKEGPINPKKDEINIKIIFGSKILKLYEKMKHYAIIHSLVLKSRKENILVATV